MANERSNIHGSNQSCVILPKESNYQLMKLYHVEVAQGANIETPTLMNACSVMKVNTKTMITMMVKVQRSSNAKSAELAPMLPRN